MSSNDCQAVKLHTCIAVLGQRDTYNILLQWFGLLHTIHTYMLTVVLTVNFNCNLAKLPRIINRLDVM